MKKLIEEWMLELGEITELQSCLADVLENCIHKDENPYYALSLVNNIREKTTKLYEKMDDFTVEVLEELHGDELDFPEGADE